MKTREQILAKLETMPEVPVLIIGAGVNGIGTFRDLALQGVDALLVDRADFCSGASSASSHMLHGGIRYLENGEFRLVREALHERNRLLRNAPHLTAPLPTAMPIFKRFSGLLNAPLKFLGLLDRPSERGALVIKLGLMLYDGFVRGDSVLPPHRFFNRTESLQSWPALNPEVRYTARYFDGFMPSPERICIELLADAEQDHDGALAVNYLPVVGCERDEVVLQASDGREFRLKPQVVVNAAGPWIDLANRRLDESTGMIGGTKGSHLIVDKPRLRAALADHEFFFEYFDGRIVLILPFFDKVMIGTTDIRIDNPDQARCTEQEIDYMLAMVPTVFPGIELDRGDIVFQFSGVRPLPAAQGRTGQISRDHKLELLEPTATRSYPILNLIGGKWTTYRAFSEQAAEAVMQRLGLSRRASTRDLAIGGGAGYPTSAGKRAEWIAERSADDPLSEQRVKVLLDRYGAKVDRFLTAIHLGESEQVATEPAYWLEELRLLTKEERVWHLDDLLLRRTSLAWTGQVDMNLLQRAGQLMAGELGWSKQLTQAEISRAAQLLREQHGMQLS